MDDTASSKQAMEHAALRILQTPRGDWLHNEFVAATHLVELGCQVDDNRMIRLAHELVDASLEAWQQMEDSNG